jgi:two-component system, LytTR family, sensor kinase
MKRLRTILGVATIWTVVALLFAAQLTIDASYSGHPIGRTQALLLALTGWYGWAILSPLVIWLARRVRPSARGVAVHAVLSVVLMLLKTAATTEILRRAGFPPRAVSLLANVPVGLATYWAIAGATWAIDAHVRSSRLEASLSEARLELLSRQIHPHFLFNTLHAISELMHEDVEAADEMTTRLADLLRASLDSAGRQEVPLSDELAILDRYVGIERVRHGERLRFETEVDPHALDLLVPSFLLQPLVENAIRHAVAQRREGGRVEVRVRREGSRVAIAVSDDGPGFAGDVARASPHSGLGLANVADRLRQLYGDEQRLELGASDSGGARVLIELPARQA